ncbi:MAG: glutamine amidotransferase [Verrucomicrobiae bacterium]
MTVYEHTFPAWLIAAALAAALASGAFSAWNFLPRRRAMAGLFAFYAAAVLGIAWCLLLPGNKSEVTQLRKPRFLIALDVSQSMALTPSQDVPRRWDAAREALKQPWLAAVAVECAVEIFPFSSEVGENLPLEKVKELEPEGTSTRLRDALKKIADRSAGLNVAGLLLLSDGVDTRETLDDWAAAERPFPVYTLRLEPPGAWQKEPDLRIDAVTTSRRVTVGWKSEFKVKISGQGTRGVPVTVQVFENGDLRAEKPTQIPDEGGERELVFEFEHPKVGVAAYRVLVPPLPGEKSKDDNAYEVNVDVADARSRLLYVEGIPRWEYKFLRRTLLAETQISPVIFFTGADGAPQAGTPAGNFSADMSPQQLAFFKIVLLGNIDAKELGGERAKNLVKFVEDGGSLILLGGTKAWIAGGLVQTDLGKILPVRGNDVKVLEGAKPFPVRLSEAAAGHPAFAGDAALWKSIPPVLSLFTGFTLSTGAEALVTAATPDGPQPVVVTQRFGQGKVTAILTDSLWRWQLGPESGNAKPYDRFWKQLISWLLPREESLKGESLEVFADRDRLFLGETVELHARMAGEPPPKVDAMEARVTLPDKREIPYHMTPQLITLPSGKSFPGFSLPFSAEVPGLYTVIAATKGNASPVTSEPFSFFVVPYSPETVPRPARVDVLQTLSKASGGAFYENLDALNQGLSAIQLHATEEKSANYRTLWQEWPAIALLMTLLAASWLIRKSQNMP